MTTGGERTGDSPVEQALAGGTPQRIGWYRFHFTDQRWEWSPEVERIHGYEPGTAHPTTEMVLSHKHPDDYEQVAATLDDIRRSHEPFSTRHRIITVAGETRDVVVIGERIHDNAGTVTGTDHAHQVAIREAVAEIAENRAVIEQVKGILCLVYRIEADAAFEFLRWRSQDTNVKLRALAEQLMVDFCGIQHDEALPRRSAFDCVLLTAHQRVRAHAAQKRHNPPLGESEIRLIAS